MPRKLWPVTCSLGILLLLIVQASAAPTLSIGSRADYSLSGTVQVNGTCSVDQPLLWAFVCGYGTSLGGTTVPATSATNTTVFWLDDGVCSLGSSSCRFVPGSLTIQTGTSIVWAHNGTLAHTVTANATANVGLPNFASGIVEPGSTYTNFFGVPGNYSYYCSIHPWMKGRVSVVGAPSPVPPPLPSPQNVVAYLYGGVDWNVKGLASTHALLEVNHNISYALAPIPLVSYAPIREQGSFAQSVNLTNRLESPSTTAGIVGNVINSITSLYGAGLIHYNLSSVTSALLDQSDYTMWWVNGPLSLGSAAPITTAFGIVTGDESLNLGGVLGTRSAWIVTSDMPHSTTAIGPLGAYANASVSLNSLWSFDKQGDLLLRSKTNASLTALYAYKVNLYSYPYASLYSSPGSLPLQLMSVMVVRTFTTALSVSLRLTDTSLNLNDRPTGTADPSFSPSSTSTSPSASLSPSTLPFVMIVGIGVISAGAVLEVLSVRKANRKRVVADIIL